MTAATPFRPLSASQPFSVSAFPTPLHAAFSNALAEGSALPADIQYMPPGRHSIRASQGGKPVSVEVAVSASTAAVLQSFLAAKLSAAAEGREDRPFFDFNHEDREASAWPTEFYWAGDDPQTGGVRARVEWSDAGKRAVEGRTFRRFSPTFHLDAAGQVTGSEINMGGLVNRAAFKRIAPLFASAPEDRAPAETHPSASLRGHACGEAISALPRSVFASAPGAPDCVGIDTALGQPPMQTLVSTLRSLSLVEASATEEADLVSQVSRSVSALKAQVSDLQASLATQARQRAESLVDAAVQAGRLPAKDTDARGFWVDALVRDEAKAVKALDALPVNPVLARLVTGGDSAAPPALLITRQEQKLAAVRAANPGADFPTIYAKAKAEAPELFR
jgi:phage I-like protein